MSTLIAAIREYLGLGLSRADAVQLAQAESMQSPPANGPTMPVMQPAGIAAVTERRKRRYRGRVVYRLTDAARMAANGSGPAVPTVKELVPSHAATLAAIASAQRLVTAREVESLAHQKRKTVESSIWNLRHMGLIESIRKDNEPAIAAATQALIAPVAPVAKRKKRRKARKNAK
jgi:hypothetical protein